MKVITDWQSLNLAGVVLSIGNFDGVHRGHQAILQAGTRRARLAKTDYVVMTFDPHPLALLTPHHVPPALTPLPEKLHWLKHHGVDATVVVHTRPEFLAMTAEAFIHLVIMGRFRPRAIVEGPTFTYGRDRQGTVETLQAAGRTLGFEVEVVEPARIALGGHPDTVISSSLIRQMIQSGTVDKAAVCLGRPYTLLGTVGHGAGRGRELGIPTANITPQRQLIPAEGVYAGRAAVRHHQYPAAISIGRTPTFAGHELLIEAHLIDFRGDLYGEPIRLEFLHWIREQRRFESPENLIRQIREDIETTRRFAGTAGHVPSLPSLAASADAPPENHR